MHKHDTIAVLELLLNLVLHWKELHWFEHLKSWLKFLSQCLGHLISPAQPHTEYVNVRSHRLTNKQQIWHLAMMIKKMMKEVPFCNSLRQQLRTPLLSSSSAYLFEKNKQPPPTQKNNAFIHKHTQRQHYDFEGDGYPVHLYLTLKFGWVQEPLFVDG